ncbi:Ig-like domain-containing protein [Hathewaya histolytica]|uniref:Ig-like domain-containing protein n=1 Tax=Hathewaya histolytica TaxID=1498 RepID=UPI003B66DCC3
MSNVKRTKRTALFLALIMICLTVFNSISFLNVSAKGNEEALIEDGIKASRQRLDKNLGSAFNYDYITALALRRAGSLTSDIANNLNLFPGGDIYNYARNIIGILASGKNPRDFNDKNYVSEIIKLQEEMYKVNNPEKLTFMILALDMAGENYNKQKAITQLLSLSEKEGTKLKLGESIEEYDDFEDEWTSQFREDTGTSALALVALSNHKDIKGVSEAIEGIKNYLKSLQSNTGFIRSKTTYSEDDSTIVTSRTVQGLIAIGENPLGDSWIKDGKSLLDALASDKSKKDLSAQITAKEVLLALTDLKFKNSAYKEIKYIESSIPARIILSNVKTSVVEGDKFTVLGQVYDLNKLLLEDEEIIWESSDSSIAEINEGNVTTLKPGTVNIVAKVKSKPEVKESFTLVVKGNEGLTKKQKEEITKEINFLKEHFKVYNSYEFLASPAARIAGMDQNHIKENIYKYTSNNSVFNISRTIITLIGAGLNPRDYENVNYVDMLRSTQILNGKEKGQFLYNSEMDKDKADVLSYAILALDMANADYNREFAIKALLDMVDSDKYKDAVGYEEIKVEGIVLTALGKYKNFKGVEATKNTLINFLKEKQNNEGGFNLAKGYFNNSPVATGAVIQGLIANGISPLNSTEWIKNGKTMLDSMLMAKYAGDTPMNWGYSKSGDKVGLDYRSTYHAFGALVDLIENQSMFEKLKLKDTDPIIGTAKELNIINSGREKRLIGEEISLKANVYDDKKNLISNAEVTWESSDNTKALVNDGLVKVLKEGSVTITAKVKGTAIESSVNFTLLKDEIKDITISLDKTRLRVGEKATPIGKAINTLEQIDNTKILSWTSSNENIAKINEHGDIEAVSPGKVTIKAYLKDNSIIEKTIEIVVVEKHKSDIKVRVEGGQKTLYKDKISYEFDTETTPIEVLRKAVGEENVEGKELPGMGYFVEGILGESQKPRQGWSYYVVKNDGTLDYPSVGMGAYKEMTDENGVSNVQELVLYMSVYTDDAVLTKIPKINVKEESGKVIFTITDAMEEGTPIEGVKISIEGIGEHITDKNGKAVVDIPKKGKYSAKISKGEPKPELVRQTLDIISNGKEEVKEELIIENITKDIKIVNGLLLQPRIKIRNNKAINQEVFLITALYNEEGKFIKYNSEKAVVEKGKEVELLTKVSVPEKGVYKAKTFIFDNLDNLEELMETMEIR